MSGARSVARAIAAVGLRDSTTIVIEPTDNDAVLGFVRNERIEGVAVAALLDGTLECDGAFATALVRQHDDTMAQTLRVEITAVRTSSLLSDSGVPHRILKGTALAHSVARTTSERSFRDVDVLVQSTLLDDVVGLLAREGASRLREQLRPGFDARFGKSVTMKLDGIEIDVHRLLCPGPFGVWMHPDDLFLLRSSVEVGGIELPTLDRTDHLVHACYHAAIGSAAPSLVNLRDIALLAAGEWDGERFVQTIDRWRGRAVVQRAIRLVEDELEVELPEALAVLRHRPVPPDERAMIEPYLTTDSGGRFADLAPATLRALPMADRVAYARAVGLPDGADVLDRVKSMINRKT